MTGCSDSDGYSTSTATEEPSQPELPVKSPVVETKPTDWYIRIVAQDITRDLKSESAQLGALNVSDAIQTHTLRAYYDFDGYLDVLFVDPAGVVPGQYRSNFHTYQEDVEESWTFTVMTNDPTVDMSLTWRGLYVQTPYEDDGRIVYKEYRSTTNPLIKQMKLVDVQTGTEMAAVKDGKTQTYTFNMDGQTQRTFKWVVETQEVSISQAVQRSAARNTVSREDVSVRKAAIREEQMETFDLNNPPFLKDGR